MYPTKVSFDVLRIKLLLFCFVICASHAFAQTKQEAIQKTLHEFITSNNIVGASVAIIDQSGELSSVAAGYADKQKLLPTSATTVYRLGSISKPVTSVAALQLVEKEALSLDNDIRVVVSDWPDKSGVITLRHLLTHTSGIRHYVLSKRDVFYKRFTVTESLGVFKDDTLLFKPGARVSYSTHAFSLVARMVEIASKQEFGKYIENHISLVAGANSLRLEDRSKSDSNRSLLYNHNAKGQSVLALQAEDISWKSGGGGMESSAEDLAKFGYAVLSSRLLSKSTTEQMLSKQSIAGLDTFRGLGWAIGEFGPEHGGAQQGCRSLLVLDIKSQSIFVVMTNTGGDYGLNEVLSEIRRIWIGS